MDGDLYVLSVPAEVAADLPEREDLIVIYKYEGKYYWEKEGFAAGPYPTLRGVLQDLALEADMRGGRLYESSEYK